MKMRYDIKVAAWKREFLRRRWKSWFKAENALLPCRVGAKHFQSYMRTRQKCNPDPHQRTCQGLCGGPDQYQSACNRPFDCDRSFLFIVPDHIRITETVCRSPCDSLRGRSARPLCRRSKSLHATICCGLYCENLAQFVTRKKLKKS